jgi:hypothetical protein
MAQEEGQQPSRLFAAEEYLQCATTVCTTSYRDPARVKDELVSTNFNHSVTRGFAAVGEPTWRCACFQARKKSRLRRKWNTNVFFYQTDAREKVAQFRQINMAGPKAHHDALEFPKGQIVLLTWLCEGQHATVLQLPTAPCIASEVEEQRRVLGAEQTSIVAVPKLESTWR